MLKKLLDSISGKPLTEIEQQARTVIRERIGSRPPRTVDTVLIECGVTRELEPRARIILEPMAGMIGVDPGGLRSSDSLADLVGASRVDLPPSAAVLLDQHGIGDRIHVFSYELMYRLETLSTAEGWRRLHESLPSPPRDEEAWIDVIVSMDLCEFVKQFAPTLSI